MTLARSSAASADPTSSLALVRRGHAGRALTHHDDQQRLRSLRGHLAAAVHSLGDLSGIVYGLKRPNPTLPRVGFHEVFHTLTVTALVGNHIAASIGTHALR